MRLLLLLSLPITVLLVLLAWGSRAEDIPAPKTVGLDKRVPWTTSKVKGSPEPSAPYRTEVAFPKLKFYEPLDLATVPGGNRFLVAERKGQIFSFVNDPKTAEPDLILDLKKTVYGITVHPDFAKNGYLYVTYIADDSKETDTGSRLARFTISRDNPPQCDPKSEKIIFEWPNGGHNGGCLKFGPDGFLYIGTGDGSGIADGRDTGQDLSDVLAAILRIDVDHPDPAKSYGIPKDNPFVGMKDARPEVWAYGLRQPWRYSFDKKTGDLWCGEVGQDLWEMVYLIQKGGNYGWSVMEGTHPFRPDRKRGPTPILPPVVEHPHSDFRSLIGGYVYRGSRLPELVGTYIYGDFDTGRIWGLRHDGKKVTWHKELTKTNLRVVTFGQDEAGEIYHVDFVGGQIHRLIAAPPVAIAAPFPRKLSETGLFESTRDLKPAAGLIPYSVNAQLWSDGATKERYLAIPGDGKIEYNTVEYPQPSPGAPRGWKFPDGTVMVKTFFMEIEKGNPASRKRLETRLLHFEKFGGTEEYGDQYWRGYTYIWNDEGTDAVLCDAGGVDRALTIKDKDAPGGERKQTWRFPSRAECTLCHTMPAKYTLGVNTLQMNKDHDYGNGNVANQLRTLEHLGLFTRPLPEAPENLPHLVDYENEKLDLTARARSYLHANCAHCHIKWGGGNAEFQLLATLDLKDTAAINTKPGQGTFDLRDPRVIVPGDPDRSLVAYRMAKLGLGRMPHVASNVVDEKGVRLIRDWIKQLPRE
jgi:uncharacterized repeat protein (TIGR03806 family)